MKTLYTCLATVFVLFAGAAAAQTTNTTYTNKNGKEVPAAEAYFFEVEEKAGTYGGTRTRFLAADSSKVSLSTYSHLRGGVYGTGVLNGPCYEWHQNGKLKAQAFYVRNELSGTYERWYESGKLHYRKMYRDNQLQDTLKAYYESGELRRIEVYSDNKLITGKLYSEAGNEIAFFPMEQMPQFPGGEQHLLRFISSNLRYPESAQKKGVGGVVIITFIIQEHGSIADVEVAEGVEAALDAEAARVIKLLPLWKPGLVEGKPTAMSFTLPIRFLANSKW